MTAWQKVEQAAVQGETWIPAEIRALARAFGSEAQWPGEAKISGRAIAAGPNTGGPDGDRFHADITEVVHTHLNDEATMLVVEWWTPTHGLRRVARE